MQVTDRFNLLPPSICIICEEAPSGKVIDTLRQLKTGVASALNGRKYVCERCVGVMAEALGFEQGDAVKRSRIDKDFAERQLAVFRQRVIEIADGFRNFADAPGAVDEDIRKPEVEEVFPPVPEEKGGTTIGVQKVADSETPAVPAPAAASSAIPVADEPEDEAPADEVDITESAAELAEEKGVDVSAVEGSGKGGRVLKSDVEAAAEDK